MIQTNCSYEEIYVPNQFLSDRNVSLAYGMRFQNTGFMLAGPLQSRVMTSPLASMNCSLQVQAA